MRCPALRMATRELDVGHPSCVGARHPKLTRAVRFGERPAIGPANLTGRDTRDDGTIRNEPGNDRIRPDHSAGTYRRSLRDDHILPEPGEIADSDREDTERLFKSMHARLQEPVVMVAHGHIRTEQYSRANLD